MPDWCYDKITIETDGSMTGEGLLSVLRDRSQFPERSFSLTSCAPVPGGLSSEPYGPAGWYDWRLINWGTKWDISVHGDEPRVECNADRITIIGETPWSPPAAALDGLAAAFPCISISLYWEGSDMEGCVLWKDAARNRDWWRWTADDVDWEDAGHSEWEGAARLSRHFHMPAEVSVHEVSRGSSAA